MIRFIIASVSLLSVLDFASAFVHHHHNGNNGLHANDVVMRSSTTVMTAHANEWSVENSRRTFVVSGMAAVASSLFLPQTNVLPVFADDSAVDYKAVAKDIMDLVEKNPDWGPS
jgi:hypothetical protein